MSIQKSGEDYLEAILVIGRSKGSVRSIDVAGELGFSKPSVSRAMSILKSGGFITVGDDGELILTDAGREKAEDVYARHCLITTFLKDILGVSKDNAEEDACLIEHVISIESYEKLKSFVEKNM